MSNAPELDKELEEIAAEIEGFLLSKNVRAVAAIIVTEDGTAHTRMRYIPGGRMTLLGGVALLQHDLVHMIQNDEHGKK